MKKVYLFFILLLSLPMVIRAESDPGYYYDDQNQTYIVVCKYDIETKSGTDEVEIHYYHNTESANYGKWGIYHERTVAKGPDFFANVFSDKGSPNVYMSSDVSSALKDSHICPKMCYLDENSFDEFCCDNGDKWCENNHTDAGTSFGESDSDYVDGEKTEDKREDTLQEIEENLYNGVTDEMLENPEALQQQINQNVNDALKDAYGDNPAVEIPDADKQYYQENQSTITETAKENLTSQINRMKELLTEDYQNGVIDEETYNSKMEVLNGYTEDKINSLFDDIFDYNFALNLVIMDQTCNSMLGNPDTEGTPAFYLVIVFTVLKYVAIILLIVLTIMDFVSAVASNDNDILKKATNKAIKRAVLCVAIFLLPTLIEFLLKYLYETSSGLCGIK